LLCNFLGREGKKRRKNNYWGKSLSSQECLILGFLVVQKMVESQLRWFGHEWKLHVDSIVRRLGEYIRWRVERQEKL